PDLSPLSLHDALPIFPAFQIHLVYQTQKRRGSGDPRLLVWVVGLVGVTLSSGSPRSSLLPRLAAEPREQERERSAQPGSSAAPGDRKSTRLNSSHVKI